MSQENVKLARKFVHAFNRDDDDDAAISCAHRDFTLLTDPGRAGPCCAGPDHPGHLALEPWRAALGLTGRRGRLFHTGNLGLAPFAPSACPS
jgi:hypothetical protein